MLVLTFALLLAAGTTPAAAAPALSVPFLSQTEALCGGAATAMVFRFWGDRHAGVAQFAPLVDRRAGGIADTTLVAAIRTRGWQAERLTGSLAAIREQLEYGRPPMLLIEDRPSRYHYVVAVGADADAVFVHDPTWGPRRRLPAAQLLRAWKPTSFWMLVVTPGRSSTEPASVATSPPARTSSTASACDELLSGALDEIAARGANAAERALGQVRAQCPAFAGPIRELAGIRFSQQRWAEAATLARDALALDGRDRYAWDVLGAARFMQNDGRGALRAWNRIRKPVLDSVQIDGLTRTRYTTIADALGLEPGTVLSRRSFDLAERRVRQLPDQRAAAISYRTDADGFATVDVRLVERELRPRGTIEWSTLAATALVNREVTTTVPGFAGQGEAWTASWRWWAERPRLALEFAAPAPKRLGGVWRVEGAWEQQTYRLPGDTHFREERRRGGIAWATWLTPGLRYEMTAGLDVWDRARRAIAVGSALEQRLMDDRLSISIEAARWNTVSGHPAFSSGTLAAWFRSSKDPVGTVARATLRLDAASDAAPLALWSGAGEGRARPGLLRGHTLLDGGVVDGVFGRRSGVLNLEFRRWFSRPSIARIGIAGFLDAAGASQRLMPSARTVEVDAGGGLRLRVPGSDNSLRFDYARGLRDGSNRVSVGWTP